MHIPKSANGDERAKEIESKPPCVSSETNRAGDERAGPGRGHEQDQAGNDVERETAPAGAHGEDHLADGIRRDRGQDRDDGQRRGDALFLDQRGHGDGGRVRVGETGTGRRHQDAGLTEPVLRRGGDQQDNREDRGEGEREAKLTADMEKRYGKRR